METFLTGPNLMLLGLMIWAGVMLRNSTAKSPRSPRDDIPQHHSRNDLATRETGESHLCEPAFQPFQSLDFERQLAARMERALALLDRWIDEADREIVRLETLLAERQANESASLSAEKSRMVVQLAAAGYSRGEIASLTNCSAAVVEEILKEESPIRGAA